MAWSSARTKRAMRRCRFWAAKPVNHAALMSSQGLSMAASLAMRPRKHNFPKSTSLACRQSKNIWVTRYRGFLLMRFERSVRAGPSLRIRCFTPRGGGRRGDRRLGASPTPPSDSGYHRIGVAVSAGVAIVRARKKEGARPVGISSLSKVRYILVVNVRWPQRCAVFKENQG